MAPHGVGKPCTPPAPLAVLALALVGSGCATVDHRCDVPQPVVEAVPAGPKLPLGVAVRTSSRVTEVVDQRDAHHTWAVEPLPPSRSMLERLAGSVFERVVPEPAHAAAPATAADAWLELSMEELRLGWEPFGPGPYLASVTYRATFRGGDGAVITAFDLSGEGGRATVLEPATHCKGIGEAVALAMQDAGAKLVHRLGSDPALATWLAARGVAAPALAVRPPEAYAVAEPAPPRAEPRAAPGSAPPEALAAASAARPVVAPAPGAPEEPRQVHLRLGGGVFAADEAAGGLEGPENGYSFTVLGVEWRPRRWVGVTLELGAFGADYSPRSLPAPPGVEPRELSITTDTLGVGVRGVVPGWIIEPWVGASALLAFSDLSAEYVGGGSRRETALSPGLDLGAGLIVHLPRGFQLGLEYRRILVRASFDVLPREVSIGGEAISLTLGASGP